MSKAREVTSRMDTFLAYAKMLAPVFAAVATALTPLEGRHAWFVAIVAGASAVSLIAPTIMPSRKNTTQNGGG